MTISNVTTKKKIWFFSWVIPKANHIFSTVESSFVNKKNRRRKFIIYHHDDFDQFFQIIPFLFMINSSFFPEITLNIEKEKFVRFGFISKKTFLKNSKRLLICKKMNKVMTFIG